MTHAHDHDHGHVHAEPPLAGSEAATLVGSLERQRATFAWKCGGLDAAGLNARVGTSTMTLGGLLKHLALIESHTFAWKVLGRSPGQPWESVDWDADPDWDWHSAADDSPEELMALWRESVERSRAIASGALAQGGMDRPVRMTSEAGEAVTLRRVLVDLIEEYARHVGHADLLRESVDGLTGEDPPA